MQIAADVITEAGSFLICKEQKATPAIISHLKNFHALKKSKVIFLQ
jgi:hypothetical protein